MLIQVGLQTVELRGTRVRKIICKDNKIASRVSKRLGGNGEALHIDHGVWQMELGKMWWNILRRGFFDLHFNLDDEIEIRIQAEMP